MPGANLSARDMTVNKTDRNPCPSGTDILGQGRGEINKYTDKFTIHGDTCAMKKHRAI